MFHRNWTTGQAWRVRRWPNQSETLNWRTSRFYAYSPRPVCSVVNRRRRGRARAEENTRTRGKNGVTMMPDLRPGVHGYRPRVMPWQILVRRCKRHIVQLALTWCALAFVIIYLNFMDHSHQSYSGCDLAQEIQVMKSNESYHAVYLNQTQDVEIVSKQNETISEHMALSYEIGCHNIRDVKLGLKLGNGVTKSTFRGSFRNRPVVVKMITSDSKDILKCVKKKEQSREECAIFPRMKLMKEILMAQQLKHPNVITLLGYCLSSEKLLGKDQNGLLAVYEEAGDAFKSIKTLSVKQKLQLAYEFVDLLEYLETNPMGSILFPDFKSNFMFAGGRIKIIDLDDMSNVEQSCVPRGKSCPFKLPCVNNTCHGANAKHNLEGFSKTLAPHLIEPHAGVSSSEPLSDPLIQVGQRLNSLNVDATELKTLIARALQSL